MNIIWFGTSWYVNLWSIDFYASFVEWIPDTRRVLQFITPAHERVVKNLIEFYINVRFACTIFQKTSFSFRKQNQNCPRCLLCKESRLILKVCQSIQAVFVASMDAGCALSFVEGRANRLWRFFGMIWSDGRKHIVGLVVNIQNPRLSKTVEVSNRKILRSNRLSPWEITCIFNSIL